MSAFDALNMMLTDMLGPNGPLFAYGGFTAFLVLAALPFFVGGQKDPMDKFKKEAARSLGRDDAATLRGGGKGPNEKINRYAQFLEPQDVKEMGEMRKKMISAGYREKESVQLYYLAQMGLGLLGLIAGSAYFFVFVQNETTTTQQMVMYILGPLVVGYMAPKYWLGKRIEKRKEGIEDGFPDALDMMLVCVEAGQSMDQAIVRIGTELRAAYPDLADEFTIVAHEMKAGKDKPSVLNDMSDRCDVQDITSFVTVLNQSQSFGTPVADALRVYAAEMRDKRVMRAEEKANKLPTKMTLTTMMLTVPPLLIILVGPSVVGIMDFGGNAPESVQEAGE